MPKKIVIVNGSYREGGMTDQILDLMAIELELTGYRVEQIFLRREALEFCSNCRHCMQSDGEQPGFCRHDDAMTRILEQLESADGYIFASPTNFGTVTALFKRFLERLSVYGYWPWKRPAPRMRKPLSKVALCVTSSAAPSLLERLFGHTLHILKKAPRCVGARVVDTLAIGFAAQELPVAISERDQRRIARAVHSLITRL